MTSISIKKLYQCSLYFNEFLTSVFAFNVSSTLSQYKDVVHDMPNTYLQVDSLFDIDKCIRICFEKI